MFHVPRIDICYVVDTPLPGVDMHVTSEPYARWVLLDRRTGKIFWIDWYTTECKVDLTLCVWSPSSRTLLRLSPALRFYLLYDALTHTFLPCLVGIEAQYPVLTLIMKSHSWS